MNSSCPVDERSPVQSDPVVLCSNGLLERLAPAVKRQEEHLKHLQDRQITLTDNVEAEKDKFVKSNEAAKLTEMLEKTSQYHKKLTSLQTEMTSLSQRSQNLKARAMRLQELKQKESLKRELKRQKELEKEEELIAKPSKKS